MAILGGIPEAGIWGEQERQTQFLSSESLQTTQRFQSKVISYLPLPGDTQPCLGRVRKGSYRYAVGRTQDAS
jgi:hypothetical protein